MAIRILSSENIDGALTIGGALTGATAGFSGSITASGNSNSFGNTSVAALSASTGTFSASITAAGNTNSFGTTTFSGDITTNGDIIIDNSSGDPFLKLKTSAQEYVIRVDQSDSEKFQIRDVTNSLTRITLDTSGNVGIGTTSPNAKLHIGPDSLVSGYTPDRSTLAISDTTNGGQLIIRGQSPRIWFDGTAGGNAELFLDGSKLNILSGRPDALGSSRLYIKADGNVGIGTDSPASKFEVYGGSSGVNDVDRYIRFKASNGEKRFDFYVGGTGNASSLGMYTSDGTTKNVQISGGGTSYFNGGNVGIGVTSPDSPLEIQNVPNLGANKMMLHLDANHTGNTGSAFLRISAGSSSGANTKIEMVTAGGQGLFGTYVDTNIINSATSSSAHGNINFVTGSSTSASSIVMTIGGGSQKGNVGIGTTTPDATLDVHAPSTTAPSLTMGATAGQIFKNEDSELAFGLMNASPYNVWMQSRFNGNVSRPFVINPLGGNVGIGTTTPTTPLQVNGIVRIDTSGNTAFYEGDGVRLFGSQNYRFRNTSGNVRAIINVTSGNFSLYNASNNITNLIATAGDSYFNGGNVGIGTTNPGAELQVVGRVKTTRIVSSNIILGNIRSNVVGTAYLLLVDLNVTAGFSLAGKVNAASYTTWNVSDIYVRKNYNATTGYATITGISKSGSTLSVVDISHSSGRFIALKLTGDPEVDVMWAGYRLDDLFQGSGEVTTLTSGVTENSVYASY